LPLTLLKVSPSRQDKRQNLLTLAKSKNRYDFAAGELTPGADCPWAIPLKQLQSGALLLFTFFMISDPKTTPD